MSNISITDPNQRSTLAAVLTSVAIVAGLPATFAGVYLGLFWAIATALVVHSIITYFALTRVE